MNLVRPVLLLQLAIAVLAITGSPTPAPAKADDSWKTTIIAGAVLVVLLISRACYSYCKERKREGDDPYARGTTPYPYTNRIINLQQAGINLQQAGTTPQASVAGRRRISSASQSASTEVAAAAQVAITVAAPSQAVS